MVESDKREEFSNEIETDMITIFLNFDDSFWL